MFNTARGALIAAALSAIALAPTTAEAGDGSTAQVTHGRFVTLTGGSDMGYDIRGGAVMLRLGDSTYVAVHVRGLDPNTTYPTHVHNAPCSATPAGGGHYQHIVGGPVDSVNEMWPMVTTKASGAGHGYASHEHRARPDAQSIVIHYPTNTAIRLACVDLG